MSNPFGNLTGYELRHLAEHLESSGRANDLHRLLTLETSEGRNAWYEAKDAVGDTTGLLADMHLAWRLAEEAAIGKRDTEVVGKALGLQCRYALVVSSLMSIAQNIPPPLLAALVNKGVWGVEKALDYARQMPASSIKAESFEVLIPYLPKVPLLRLVTACQEIEDDRWGEPLRRSLASRLAEIGCFEEAIDLVFRIREDARWDTLIKVCNSLTGVSSAEAAQAIAQRIQSNYRGESTIQEILYSRLSEIGYPEIALSWVREIQDERRRAYALARLVPHLPAGIEQEMLSVMQGFQDKYNWVRILEEPSPCLSGSVLQYVLEEAQQIEEIPTRALVLTRLSSYLPESQQPQILQDALTAGKEIENPIDRIETLTELALLLSKPLQNDVLEDVLTTISQRISDEEQRIDFLIELTPHLPEFLLKEALTAVRSVSNEWERAKALSALGPYLPEVLLGEALTMAQKIGLSWRRAKALSGLAHYLPEHLLRESVTIAKKLSSNRDRGLLLLKLSHRLVELGYFEDALILARDGSKAISSGKTLGDELAIDWHPWNREYKNEIQEIDGYSLETLRERGLGELAYRLAVSGCYEQALAIIQEIKGGNHYAETLVHVVPKLPQSILKNMLPMIMLEIQSEHTPARVVAKLIPYLPQSLLKDILLIVRELKLENTKADILADLAPHLSEDLLREALDMAWAFNYANHRRKAFAGLIPRMTEPFLREVLGRMREIGDVDARVQALSEFAMFLSEKPFRETIRALREMKDPREAVTVAQEIRDPGQHGETLKELAHHSPDVLQAKIIQETLATLVAAKIPWEDEQKILAQISELAKLLADLGHPEEALSLVRETKTDNTVFRAKLCSELAQFLQPALREQVLGETLEIVSRIYGAENRKNLLIELAPKLPELLLERALIEAWKLSTDGVGRDESLTVDALAGLAPYLSEKLWNRLFVTLRHEIKEILQLSRETTQVRETSKDYSRQNIERLQEKVYIGSRRHLISDLLVALAPHLPDNLFDDALDLALSILGPDHGMALAGLAPYLPNRLHRKALVAVNDSDITVLGNVLGKLAPYMSEELMDDTLSMARRLVQHVNKSMDEATFLANSLGYEYDVREVNEVPARALIGLVSYLPDGLLGEAIGVALEVENTDQRATILKKQISYVRTLSIQTITGLWLEKQGGNGFLHTSANRSRNDLLSDICAFAPVIVALGGKVAAFETCRAIQDVGRWWP
jgi:hypothetical protein